jgi:hypothetical protein
MDDPAECGGAVLDVKIQRFRSILMIRSIILLLLFGFCLSGKVAAQPDRTAALEKAKAKFEKDIAKIDETILSGIDKTILQATKAGNKALQEKLNYERPLFVTQHIVPTAFPCEGYLQQRTKATSALLAVYQPAMNELTKAKKFAEATALEDTLDEILVASRGYGLAFPDLETHPGLILLIENKEYGTVIDIMDGVGLVLSKTEKNKSSQLWRLEREEKGFVIRSVKYKHAFHVPQNSGDAGAILRNFPTDKTKELESSFLYRMTSVRHEIVIARIEPELIVTATEKKLKGETTIYVTQEKKDVMPKATQLWKLVEVK